MRPRSKSFINKSDLKTSSAALNKYVDVFNSRLTKKLNTSCRINVVDSDCLIKGAVKINFDFKSSILMRNYVKINDQDEDFITSFQFSSKAKLVVPLCSHDTVTDLRTYIMDKFSILATEDLQLWERELSVSQHDIFFRKLQAKEKPLELFLLWKLNGERKSMVLMDHDPNMARFKNCPLDELELRVHNLDTEEQDLIQSIKDNYEKAKDVINELLINGVD